MNLPNYFLADLPGQAALSTTLLREACQTLRRNRQRYLVSRSTQQVITSLSQVAASWLQPEYPLRRRALDLGPAATGFSRPVLEEGLACLFEELTPINLRALIAQDLGQVGRLDGFEAEEGKEAPRVKAQAHGPGLLVHITAGTIPSPALLSIVLGLLVRASQFVKCASGMSLLPRLFAHSIHETDPKLGACLEVAEWPGGHESLETVLFQEADCVTVTGRDETLQDIGSRLPPRTRLLGYGHRVSFGYLAREGLLPGRLDQLAVRAADDVVAWDQLGCLSPHVFYVEEGGMVRPEVFAEVLARELEQRERTHPRGLLSTDLAAAIRLKRDFYQIRADHADHTRLWASANSTAWTVVYEADPLFQVSCLHRFVYVKPARGLAEILQAAEPLRHRVSTVGLDAPAGVAQRLAISLAAWGVPRICPLGRMQRPPLTWRHDGRPALADLVVWTDCEIPDST